MDASPSPSFPGTTPGSKRSTWGPGIGGGGAFSTGGSYGGSLGLGRRRTSAHLRRSRLATPDRAAGVPLPVDEDEDSIKAASDIGEDSVRLAPLPQFASDSEATPRTPPRRTRTVQSPLSIGLGTPGSGTFGSAALSTIRRTSNNPIQTSSLAAIRHSLNVARASRRHTAAHLMALRFTDGDGEYWEDVRSVMGLLSAGMEDAAARLAAAVEGTKEGEAAESILGSEGVGPNTSLAGIVSPLSAGFGFAPTIPPRERFAMHVHELVDAAGRAKDLAGSLFQSNSKLDSEADVSSSPDTDMEVAPAFPLSIEEEEARLEAVRRELGTALRQLERARAVLRAQRVRKDGGGEAEAEDSDVPALDGSPSSPATSEKMEFAPLEIEGRRSLDSDVGRTLESAHVRPDDASAYLLLATSARDLPPPGIEQVFEAEPEDMGVAVKRPRSTLSRAERIAAARAKRVVSSPLPGSASSAGTGENWGPGGDVVQELKAVISEVGSRRRKAADMHSQAQPQAQLRARPQVPVRGALPQLDLSLAAGLSPPVEIEGERL